MDELLDDLVVRTHNGGCDQWKPCGDAKRGEPGVGAYFDSSSLTLSDFKSAKETVARIVVRESVHFCEARKGTKVELKRTEDVAYGIKVFFKTQGDWTTIALFYGTLIEVIRKELKSDLSSVAWSRGAEPALIIIFNRPIKVEFCAFFVRILFWAFIFVGLYQLQILCRDRASVGG